MKAVRSMYFADVRDKRYQGQLTEWYRLVKGERLRPATRRAFTEIAGRFYNKAFPPAANHNQPVDFGDAALLQEFRNGAVKLVATKGVLPEFIFAARAEDGLYSTLHRMRARVNTSAIVRNHLHTS